MLAGATALRGGAGLVTIASGDPEVQAQLIALRPELMGMARGEPPVPGAAALVVGPGLTRAAGRVGLGLRYRAEGVMKLPDVGESARRIFGQCTAQHRLQFWPGTHPAAREGQRRVEHERGQHGLALRREVQVGAPGCRGSAVSEGWPLSCAQPANGEFAWWVDPAGPIPADGQFGGEGSLHSGWNGPAFAGRGVCS